MQPAQRRRVGLVGAGAISPHHVEALQRLDHVDIVGVHDVDESRARQLAQRYGLRALPSLGALVEEGASVIHVLTPPDSHVRLGIEALERGCHVLVEKPLAEDVADAESLAQVAAERKLTACVDHSLLFDPLVLQARKAVEAGAIGEVVSVDILRSSTYPPYRGGPLPPTHRRAGAPFRDLGAHALYLCQAFLGPIEDVQGSWRSHGGDRNLAFDEWRALVRCAGGNAQFQLSWNTRPLQHQIIVQGTRGILHLDLMSMSRSLRFTTPLPKAAERLLGGLTDATESLGTIGLNALRFAMGAIRPFQGVRNLVTAYHRSLDGEAQPPVSMSDAVEVVRWTEEIARAAEEDAASRLGTPRPNASAPPYLVTGASGKLGGQIVEQLLSRGERVRCFMRRPPAQRRDGVEVVLGDLGDPDAVDRAVRGVRTVIHAGAAMAGGWDEHRRSTVEGTRHVVEACRRHGVDKLVHVSSLSVIRYADGSLIVDETSKTEPHPERRGSYTQAKLEAENLVRAGVEHDGLRAVILRPGQIFGGGIPLLTPAVARRIAGRWLVLGDGEVRLPLIHMDDVVDAVLRAAEGELHGGEVVQLSDGAPTQNEILARVDDGRPILRLPRGLLFAAGKLSEPLFAALGRTSPVSGYRLRSALAKRTFVSRNADLLGWRPRVGVEAGIERELEAVLPP